LPSAIGAGYRVFDALSMRLALIPGKVMTVE